MVYRQTTLTSAAVPDVMRVPAIQSGYRLQKQPWCYYFTSIFHLHNETVNIWTHLIGACLVLYQNYAYFQIYSAHNSEIKWTLVGFGTCCFLSLLNSTVAHTLQSKSAYVNYMVFLYDYLGCVCWGFGMSFLSVYGNSDKDTYHWIGSGFIVVQLILAYANFINLILAKLWYGHDLLNVKRKLMIVGGLGSQCLSNTIPLIPRYFVCYQSPDCKMSSLNHISSASASFCAMTIAYCLHLPERTNKGRFDIIGQSHQIFHVLVVLTQCLQFKGLYVDFLSGANSHCHPGMFRTFVCITGLNVAGLATLYCARNHVKRYLYDSNSNKIK